MRLHTMQQNGLQILNLCKMPCRQVIGGKEQEDKARDHWRDQYLKQTIHSLTFQEETLHENQCPDWR